MGAAVKSSRVDIVWDLYTSSNIKHSIQTKRQNGGIRRPDLPYKGPIPSDWNSYLKCNDNKVELFNFLGNAFLNGVMEIQTIVTNIGERIHATSSSTNLRDIELRLDEADIRIFCHARDMVVQGITSILIVCMDTDVLVLAISYFHTFQEIGLKEMWVMTGTGNKRRFISVGSIAHSLGEKKARALRGFHAFSGCDTTSFLMGKGKKTLWKTFLNHTEALDAFYEISNPISPDRVAELLRIFEKFLINVYDKNSPAKDVNESRKLLFSKSHKPIQMIPPTSSALLQHTLRTAYQAGEIWSRGVEDPSKIQVSCPTNYGWKFDNGTWKPLWSVLPSIWEACKDMGACACLKDCTSLRCSCKRNNLICTLACKNCYEFCENKIIG
ncbi:uncharacterized protein LOC129790305 [Lutzomyia longipalpis]|uniref:uncharacterized protein LOC129790305 n=1 Tax=Lutzomyia longipalpis TaxID=7200 RepID=UPI0024833BB4|nr:uncharacterized protein LOC129790305 [Lutzomyia longipalpis]